MGLASLVEYLVDDSSAIPAHLRAIRLFELQVAFFYPEAFTSLVKTQDDRRAPRKILRTARIYAAVKFLEDIEARLREETQAESISIQQLAENRDFRDIFNEVISPNGGWTRLRHSISVGTFDRRLKEKTKAAKIVADIIDFSYRYEFHHSLARRRGGVTGARYVVIHIRTMFPTAP